MLRKLTDHKVAGLNADLEVYAVDEPGQGNASHVYDIASDLNPGTDAGGTHSLCRISFQNGPVSESGINGVTQETLLTVLIDRLRGFQSGAFACRENAIALTDLEEALMWLQKRTRDRLARGIEGTSQK